MNTQILSWNVNGLRAVLKKGFLEWLQKEQPDILCLQETKAQKEQLPIQATDIDGYNSYFFSAQKKGYSGVAIYSKSIPDHIQYGFGNEKFDNEGRTIIAYYKNTVLFNIYFPNGKASKDRLKYKMDFYAYFMEYANDIKKQGYDIIVCGDVNTAHKPIDLAHPKQNEKTSGFLPEERAWIDAFLESGYYDTLRIFNQEPENYSWWDYKTRARDRNVGWRIDYFYISESLKSKLNAAYILNDIFGSDHCPIGIDIAL